MSDNQPQVGTCPRCGSDNKSAFRQGGGLPVGSCWFPDDFDDWHRQFVPQPTPAEPRIETVHDSFTCETPNCPACWGESKQEGVEGDYVGIGRNGPTPRVEAGAQPEPEELAERIGYKIQRLLTDKYTNSLKIAVGIIAQELGRARAGSSLIAEPEKSKLTTFVCDCGRKLLVEGQVIGKELGASPPSSPGAAQTCPTCSSPQKDIRNGLAYTFNPGECPDNWHESSSSGAPQEQKLGSVKVEGLPDVSNQWPVAGTGEKEAERE